MYRDNEIKQATFFWNADLCVCVYTRVRYIKHLTINVYFLHIPEEFVIL